MSTIKVNGIRGVGASTDAITVNNTDGTCTAKITNNLKGPNLCRNGVMQIWQRGTSIASSNGVNEGFPGGPDGTGIFYHSGSSGACTISKDTDVPTDTTYGQFKDSLKLDVTTANASPSADHRIQFQHHIEAQDLRSSGWDYTAPNSKMTLSFWVLSVKTGT